MVGKTTSDGTDIWATDDGTLLAVSDEATYIAHLSPLEAERLMAEILAGAPVGITLSDARKIPHEKIVAVLGHEKAHELEFQRRSLLAKATLQGSNKFLVFLADEAILSEVLVSLQRHCGPNATVKRIAPTPLKATIRPIIAAGFFAICTWAIASGFMGSEYLRQSGRELFAKIVDALGPTGVIIVGALAILGCVYWGYRRFKNPPITVIVKPK